MLVRFLSYAASIIGARRYKPLLISGLVVGLSITGISIVASSLWGTPSDAASRVRQGQADQAAAKQNSTEELRDLEKKAAKDEAGTAVGQPTPTDEATEKQKQASTTTPATDDTLELSLNTMAVSLAPSGAAASVTATASASPPGTLQWTITPETSSGLSARLETQKDTTGSATIRFRSDSVTSGTYQFTVTVKDSTKQLSASKTVTVTVH